mmetsp:Transcript_16734/g.24251  ORF Transcript_16734/g.24251 Transcript_16734/m.24251 type:complete len:84 (+) Transcript_16734:1190-1441(+)
MMIFGSMVSSIPLFLQKKNQPLVRGEVAEEDESLRRPVPSYVYRCKAELWIPALMLQKQNTNTNREKEDDSNNKERKGRTNAH